ncbi:MAG: polysaccharide deacetylase family protein [Sulfobacillus benefaciens]|uniref:Polysaccharide deacetylase family protein n=1 Tax=Sulfobacillus benefaciens TaxID=453960 RepID=A0A2T2XEL9_9FIRM|nr:MAG: polysaccharide deacetylase family protein [Sulfobacillus benefaciens]
MESRWFVLSPVLLLVLSLWLVLAAPPVPALSRVNTQQRIVALTFDDGPSPQFTPKILSLLTQYHAKGTFFVLGSEAEKYPNLVKAIYQQGSLVANHGWGHLNLRRVGAARMWQDADKTGQLLRSLGISPAPYYRPPYGMTSQALLQLFEGHGYEVVLWSVDTRDWATPGVGSITEKIQRLIQPGAIILMHDGGGNRSQTVAALKWLLTKYTALGWHFVTLAQLTHPDAMAVTHK